MKRVSISRWITSVLLISIPAHPGCGGTSVGNPQISVQFGQYQARNGFLEFLIPSAFASLSNTKICIKRLRFKTADVDGATSSATTENFDFQPGEIAIDANSVEKLGTLRVPSQVYRRIEFDLAPDGLGCTSGNSVTMTNTNGSYTTTDGMTITFEGTFLASSDGQVLTLGLQGIVNGLNTVSGPSGVNSSIKTVLENASVRGSF